MQNDILSCLNPILANRFKLVLPAESDKEHVELQKVENLLEKMPGNLSKESRKLQGFINIQKMVLLSHAACLAGLVKMLPPLLGCQIIWILS